MSTLPEKFRPVFWDTDFNKLDKEKNAAYIISRLYNKGGFPGIFWVHENYTDEEIIYAAKTRRDFDPIVANYLREKYHLRKEEMNYYRMHAQDFWG